MAEKKAEVGEMNARAKELDEALTDALARLPNLPHDDIPDGADEADNVEIHRWGNPPEIAGAKEHYDLPAARGLILKRRRNSLVRALSCCAARWRGFTVRWRSSCWTRM